MQTRAAAKRAADEATAQALQPKRENKTSTDKSGTKRPAESLFSLGTTQENKRTKTTTQEASGRHDPQVLPHGLGSLHYSYENARVGDHHPLEESKEDWRSKSEVSNKKADGEETNSPTPKTYEKSKKGRIPRCTKANPYGLMPGRTPFPDHVGPTIDQCQKVYDILTELHGEFKPPSKIPPPSTEVAGCGEVPDLVDAMIRTLISGHTSMGNANKAIKDVIATFGQLGKDSVGAGSIDWNKVRLASEGKVMQAIKSAGLGMTKSKDIKHILDAVHEENQLRRDAYLGEMTTGKTCDVPGAAGLSQGQKDHQLLKIKSEVLTMDHIRGMTSDEAMLEFTKYPGIGVKTASCLILFCLQQPSFAVDTHVWRICKWLGWVPRKASRNDTYMHCELRVPNHLKYGLHQLFIQHGKSCGRCRSNTAEGTSEWANVACPLEDLLDRFDKRKAKVKSKKAVRIERKTAVKLESSVKPMDISVEDETVDGLGEGESYTAGPRSGDDESGTND